MSFKKFGGLNYSAKSNIISNHYSNSGNLGITDTLGQPNSKIVSQSHIDMSANSIMNIGSLYFMDGTMQTTALETNPSGTAIFKHGILVFNGTTTDTLHVTDASQLDGAVTMGSTLEVADATTLNSTLEVVDATTLNSTLEVTGTTTIDSNGNVTSSSASGAGVALNLSAGGAFISKDLMVYGGDIYGPNGGTLNIGSANNTINIGTDGTNYTTNINTNLHITNIANIINGPYIYTDRNSYVNIGTMDNTTTTSVNITGAGNTSSTDAQSSLKAALNVYEGGAFIFSDLMVYGGGNIANIYGPNGGTLNIGSANNTINIGTDGTNYTTNINTNLHITNINTNPITGPYIYADNNSYVNIGTIANTTTTVNITGGGNTSSTDTQSTFNAALNVYNGGVFIYKDLMVYGRGGVDAYIYGPSGGILNIGDNTNTINIAGTLNVPMITNTSQDDLSISSNNGITITTTNGNNIDIGSISAQARNVTIIGGGNVISTDIPGGGATDSRAALQVQYDANAVSGQGKGGGLFVGQDLMVYGGNIYGPINPTQKEFNIGPNNTIINIGTTDSGATVTIGNECIAQSFNSSSDYRIKEDVAELNDEFNVDKLRPVTYTNKNTKKQDIGFIAHEVQEEFPYLVSGEKDGEKMQSLNYIGLIGILVKEIQELKKRVSILENK